MQKDIFFKRVLFLWLTVGLFQACSLDYPLEDKLVDPDAVDGVDVAREVLNGAYLNSFKQVGTLGFLSDDFTTNNYSAELKDAYFLWNWRQQELFNNGTSLWSQLYQAILSSNTVLQRLPNIPQIDDETTIKVHNLQAEALSLKAWNYYVLVRLYAPTLSASPKADGVVIRDNERPQQLGRSSVENVYAHLDSLLNVSLSLFGEDESKSDRTLFMNRQAVWALQSEMAADRKDWERVLDLSDKLLNGRAVSASQYSSLWTFDGYRSSESIFALSEGEEVWGDMEVSRPDINKFYSGLDIDTDILPVEEDVRFQELWQQENQAPSIAKYRSGLNDKTKYPVHIFRLGRTLLLASEAAFHSGNEALARQYLNKLRKARGIKEKNSAGQQLWKDIELESRYELVGEWFRLFDVKRQGKELKKKSKAGSVTRDVVIAADDYRWVWPLPLAEVLQSGGKIKQNPGW